MVLLSLVVFCPAYADATPGDPGIPADPNATQAARNLLTYLYTLPNEINHRLITGQWGNWHGMNASALDTQERINTATGHYPGLWGINAWGTTSPATNPPEFSLRLTSDNIIAWANSGGIVEIDPFFPHPITGGSAGDLTAIANFEDVYTDNGNATNAAFNATLDAFAVEMLKLQTANVAAVVKPFSEMSGGWFWWGANVSTTQYKALWQYTFTYLTQTKGVHNILWTFSEWHQTSSLNYYPGAIYVDIVGIDVYNYLATSRKVTNYDAFVATGKPFALTEFGLQHYGSDPPMDLNAAIQDIKASMPETVYFMLWNEGWAMDLQNNISAALNDPWVKNRDTPACPIATLP